jgi:hypothetical protein
MPEELGLAIFSFKDPSSGLPKYWNTVLVPGDSKSRMVV